MYSINITVPLAAKLIRGQFPQWAELPIVPVEQSGLDNRTFRLGAEMLIRLPSAEKYALQVEKEQKWLPILSPHLSFRIPDPIAMGQPSKEYPWHWSIYRWIEGKSANVISHNDLNFPLLATQLAQFLNELHQIDATDGPLPGAHNFYRGAHPSIYDAETRAALIQLEGVVNTAAATTVWQKALSSKWNKKPVWIHGDMSSGNMLIKDGKLAAVIDFGCMGFGDPACDLVIALTFLHGESRSLFKSLVPLDADTWDRARGWALWKALITLQKLNDKASIEGFAQQSIIKALINEYEVDSA